MDEILKNLKDKEIENVPEQKEFDEEGKELEPQIYIPQAEYTAVCNADFLPMICNDFITEFLDKDDGACQIDKGEAIDLVRNFCFWIAENDLTCAKITMYT